MQDYFKYLLSLLREYLNSLLAQLEIEKEKFGVGKGTGNALTRFRTFKSMVSDSLSEEEKAFFMGWLCKHIRKMEVFLMKDGGSEKVFNLLFPDITNYDTTRKAGDNAWDARAGELTIDSASNITPKIQELFNKITSLKTQTGINNEEEETGRFSGNKLQSASLVYFLLSEYGNYGFKLGNIEIDPEEAYLLQQHKFPNNEKEFDQGYKL